MSTLIEMVQELNEDKSYKYNTDKQWSHNYIPIYDKFFYPFKFNEMSLLEIGLAEGGSLDLWNDYFVNGKIYGIDCESNIVNKLQNKPYKDNIFLGNQANIDFLKICINKVGPLDILIDDGSHNIDDQINTFELLFPYIKNGGLFVVEDLDTSLFYDAKSKITERNAFEYFKNLADILNFRGHESLCEGICGSKKLQLEIMKRFKNFKEINYFEKWIKAVHFYKNICIIEKEDFDWQEKDFLVYHPWYWQEKNIKDNRNK